MFLFVHYYFSVFSLYVPSSRLRLLAARYPLLFVRCVVLRDFGFLSRAMIGVLRSPPVPPGVIALLSESSALTICSDYFSYRMLAFKGRLGFVLFGLIFCISYLSVREILRIVYHTRSSNSPNFSPFPSFRYSWLRVYCTTVNHNLRYLYFFC